MVRQIQIPSRRAQGVSNSSPRSGSAPDALKQARAKVYAEQEDARKKLLNDRAEALKAARGKAAGHVASAKERVTREFETAKQDIESSVGQLAAEIAQRVIQIPPPRPSSPVREVS